MTTAPLAVATELASSGLADSPALHAAIVAPLVVIGMAGYLVRRRRKADHELHGGQDQYDSGSDGPTEWKERA